MLHPAPANAPPSAVNSSPHSPSKQATPQPRQKPRDAAQKLLSDGHRAAHRPRLRTQAFPDLPPSPAEPRPQGAIWSAASARSGALWWRELQLRAAASAAVPRESPQTSTIPTTCIPSPLPKILHQTACMAPIPLLLWFCRRTKQQIETVGCAKKLKQLLRSGHQFARVVDGSRRQQVLVWLVRWRKKRLLG